MLNFLADITSTPQSDTVVIALAILSFLASLTTTIVGAIVVIMTREQSVKLGVTHDLVNGASEKIVKLEKAISYAAGAAGEPQNGKGETAGPPQEPNSGVSVEGS